MLKHRYVVVDLNAIEEGLRHYIHDEDHVVLPHMIMSDLAGIKEDKRISKHINCLPGWLIHRNTLIILYLLKFVWACRLDNKNNPCKRKTQWYNLKKGTEIVS